MAEYDRLFKIVIIGDRDIGRNYLTKTLPDIFKFKDQYDFADLDIKIDNEIIRLRIWTVINKPTVKSMTSSYYRTASGVILIYDTTSRESFESIKTWKEDADHSKPDNSIVFLIGTYTNQEGTRQVSYNDAHSLSLSLGIQYIEVKVADVEDLNTLFERMTKQMLKSQGIVTTHKDTQFTTTPLREYVLSLVCGQESSVSSQQKKVVNIITIDAIGKEEFDLLKSCFKDEFSDFELRHIDNKFDDIPNSPFIIMFYEPADRWMDRLTKEQKIKITNSDLKNRFALLFKPTKIKQIENELFKFVCMMSVKVPKETFEFNSSEEQGNKNVIKKLVEALNQ